MVALWAALRAAPRVDPKVVLLGMSVQKLVAQSVDLMVAYLVNRLDAMLVGQLGQGCDTLRKTRKLKYLKDLARQQGCLRWHL